MSQKGGIRQLHVEEKTCLKLQECHNSMAQLSKNISRLLPPNVTSNPVSTRFFRASQREGSTRLSPLLCSFPLSDGNVCSMTVSSGTASDDVSPYRGISFCNPAFSPFISLSPLPAKRKFSKVRPWSTDYLICFALKFSHTT